MLAKFTFKNFAFGKEGKESEDKSFSVRQDNQAVVSWSRPFAAFSCGQGKINNSAMAFCYGHHLF